MVIMIWKRNTLIIICLSFFIWTGCKNKDQHETSIETLDNKEIVCPLLYQKNDTIENALTFIEAPEEEFESYISNIQKTGELVGGDMLKFANKYFSLSTNKDPNLFISMLSDKTKDILDDDSKNGMLLYRINAITEGTFINSKNEYKFMAVYRKVSNEQLETLANANFTQTPTHIINFFHFYRPKYMLIGVTVYFVEEQGSYKIVSETMSKDKLAALIQRKTNYKSKTQEYGIVLYEENDKAYDDPFDWKYTFEIAVRPDDTINNTFEMLKLSDVISGQNQTNIHPDITKQALMKKEIFEKYKFKQLNFKFLIGCSEPGYNYYNYGQRVSGWSYDYSIGNTSVSSTMYFLGEGILNLQINKSADFINSDLELISFESEKDGVRYKNRVLLRKTPIEK